MKTIYKFLFNSFYSVCFEEARDRARKVAMKQHVDDGISLFQKARALKCQYVDFLKIELGPYLFTIN